MAAQLEIKTPAPAIRPPRLPWTGTAAVLVALTALTISRGGSLIVLVLGVGLLATYLFDVRLTDRPWVQWTGRLLLFGIIGILNRQEPTSGVPGLFDARAMNTLGQLCAAELVLRCWRELPRRSASPWALTLATLPMSGGIFLAACDTFDYRYVRYFAPAFFLFVALSLQRSRLTAGAPAVNGPTVSAARMNVAQRLRLTALLLAIAAGGALFLSVWNFRGQLTAWGNNYLSYRRLPERAGMSSAPVLGPSFNLQGSVTRVLLIQDFSGDNHLRGMSFDTYSRGRWLPELDQRRTQPALLMRLHPLPGGTAMHVTRLNDDTDILFAPLNAAGLDPLEGDAVWAPDKGGPILVKLPAPYPYDVFVPNAEDHQGPLCTPPLDPPERKRCLIVPGEIDPKVRQLAYTIAGRLPNARERVSAVVKYLMTHNAYSLTINPGPGDPISNFVLQHKAGHCEFFASAAVMLLRSAGVPARYVDGYYAHEGAGAGLTVVRQRDAHAWTEAWIDGTGWITVDATPGNGRPDELAGPIPLWRAVWEWIQARVDTVRNWLENLNEVQVALAAGFLFIVFLTIRSWWAAKRRRLEAESAFAYFFPDLELAALAARFEAWLRARGMPCPPDRTWEEHLAQREQPLAFVRAYYNARFGDAADRAAIAQLRDLLQNVEKDTS